MQNLKSLGFSLWCDFIEKEFLQNEFKNLIENGAIYGATSNPAIFSNAILTSPSYKQERNKMQGQKAKEIYENLAFSDIENAASALLPLWEKNKSDGFISIEIDPLLCENAAKSIDEGRRIWKTINKPNLMIKVPANAAGLEIINALSKDKININATLIFSPKQCRAVLDSIVHEGIQAVISIFVSRFDRLNLEKTTPKLGIYNAIKCKNTIQNAQNESVRALFASTGTKDESLDKNYYMNNLIFKNTINTAPLDSLHAFINNGARVLSNEPSEIEIDNFLAKFDMENIYQKLMEEGLEAFRKSFELMLSNI